MGKELLRRAAVMPQRTPPVAAPAIVAGSSSKGGEMTCDGLCTHTPLEASLILRERQGKAAGVGNASVT